MHQFRQIADLKPFGQQNEYSTIKKTLDNTVKNQVTLK